MTELLPPAATIDPQMLGWLASVIQAEGSDLHLVAGYPPTMRLHGELVEMAEPPLAAEGARKAIESLCPPEIQARLVLKRDADFSLALSIDGQMARFRANLFHTGGSLAACLRVVPTSIPDFDWAQFPRDLADKLAFLRDGLVIVTGATGSGKTTTLAMIVNLINQAGGYRIITVEQPVEYLFPRAANSLVTQREVGIDVESFADGLKYGLRQDPDVILVGEMRDLETISTAITAAETGHLVLATLHTVNAAQTIDRIVDVFPPHQQPQVRMQLSVALEGVLSQALLPLKGGKGRIAAVEVMVTTPAIRNLIREGKTHQLSSTMQSGAKDGMQILNQALRELVRADLVTFEAALAHTSNPQELAQLLGRNGVAAASL